MNRRDFVRVVTGAAVATPLGAFPAGTPGLASEANYLQVYLDGPFALVLDKPSKSVTALAPVEMCRAHKFHFHGERDNSLNHTLMLKDTGLEISPDFPTPSQEFDKFKGPTKVKPSTIKAFVEINLPAWPQEIMSFSSTKVTVEGSADEVDMPLDHVLRYNISDIRKVQLTWDRYSWSPDKIGKNSGQFHLQVGMPRGADPDGAHAIKFFNERLLGMFPDCGVKKLKSIKNAAAIVTTDVECKNGGLILMGG